MDDEIDIDMCEGCFNSFGREDHWHTDGWLQVDTDGTHTKLLARTLSTSSSVPPEPDRLVRAVTASLDGRPCAACTKILGLGDEVVQLRCRCTYHSGCLQPDDDYCVVCSSPKNAVDTTTESVFVKAADGRTLTFGVRSIDTIGRLKELIAEEDQVVMELLELTWNGNAVQDGEPLLHFIGSPMPLELKVKAPAS